MDITFLHTSRPASEGEREDEGLGATKVVSFYYWHVYSSTTLTFCILI